ncbi:MAG: winged helix-turn-helix transcriptional regulator [Euryarchaeota archaeon]|nr:winged helix-turn-helix transcriptional regulator [Euryarchaeota archaeon]
MFPIAAMVGLAQGPSTRGRKKGGRLGFRELILAVLRRRQGATVSDLRRETHLGWGSLQYHLHVLRRSRAIQELRLGHAKHLFTKDAAANDLRGLALLRHGRLLEVAERIAAEPGLTQAELLRSLDIARGTLREYLRQMKEAGLVEPQTDDTRPRYFPTDHLSSLVPVAARAADADIGPGPTGPPPSR